MSTIPDKKITKILESESKGKEEARGVLSHLWRVILSERKIMPSAWARYMSEYLSDPRNGIPTEGKKRSSDRNNLNKELSRPDMTWNVFYKGLKLLQVVRFKMDITLTFPSGRSSTHTTVVNIRRKNDPVNTDVGDTDHD